MNLDASVTIELKFPIQANGETVSKLTLRRPKTKEMKQMDQFGSNYNAAVAELISNLAGIPPSSVDQLDAVDFDALSDAILDMRGKLRRTGATS